MSAFSVRVASPEVPWLIIKLPESVPPDVAKKLLECRPSTVSASKPLPEPSTVTSFVNICAAVSPDPAGP